MVLKINNSLCNYKCKKCSEFFPGLPRAAKAKGQNIPEWMQHAIAGSLEVVKRKIGCSALYLSD